MPESSNAVLSHKGRTKYEMFCTKIAYFCVCLLAASVQGHWLRRPSTRGAQLTLPSTGILTVQVIVPNLYPSLSMPGAAKDVSSFSDHGAPLCCWVGLPCRRPHKLGLCLAPFATSHACTATMTRQQQTKIPYTYNF